MAESNNFVKSKILSMIKSSGMTGAQRTTKHSKLLAALLLLIIPVSLVMTIFPGLVFYGNQIEIMIFLIVLSSSFLLVFGYLFSSVVKEIYIVTVVVLLSLFILVSSTFVDVNIVPFLVVPLLLCAIFLSTRITISVVIFDLLGILILPTYVFKDGFSMKVVWGMAFVIVAGFLLVLVIKYREQLQKAHKEAIGEGEKQFRALLNTTTDSIVTIDPNGIIQQINENVTKTLGYEAADLVDLHLSALIQDIPKKFPKKHILKSSRGAKEKKVDVLKTTAELMCKSKMKDPVPTEVTFAPWKSDRGISFTVIIRNISERKEMFEKITDRNRELEKLNKIMLGREEKMMQLKGELSDLKVRNDNTKENN
jgi:PAS domain S-box-containing protein